MAGVCMRAVTILATFCVATGFPDVAESLPMQYAGRESLPTHYAGRPEDLQVSEDDALCALQSQQARVQKSALASGGGEKAEVGLEGEGHPAGDAIQVAAQRLNASPLQLVAPQGQKTVGPGSEHESPEQKHGAPFNGSFKGIVTLPSGYVADSLNASFVALDMLPNKLDFQQFVGTTALTLTIAFINDLFYPVFWTDFLMTDGHVYSTPTKGSLAMPGQMFVVQAFAHSDGLAGKVLLTDLMGNSLSAAYSSYRVRNLFSGCDALKVRCMKTKEWDLPEGQLCTTKEVGVFKKNDYEVLVSIGKAE